jgi:hypothetical protein
LRGSVTGTHALGATIRNTETRSLVATEAHIARIGDFEEDLTAVWFQLLDEALALSDPYHQRRSLVKTEAATA